MINILMSSVSYGVLTTNGGGLLWNEVARNGSYDVSIAPGGEQKYSTRDKLQKANVLTNKTIG